MIGRGAVAVVALLALLPGAAAADEASPWPESGSAGVQVRAVRSVVARLERKVELMEWSAARYADWRACLRRVPVSEYGDPDRQFGYAYDEGDGTGPGFMPALAVDRTSRPRREAYLFLAFRRDAGCRSHAPQPGGTADAASARVSSRAGTLRSLERRVRRLKRAVGRLEATAKRFDAWESCVSQVPVTEYGDPDGGFGYLFRRRGATSFAFRPALAIDRSDRDDPDYLFLAFVGGNRPGGTCQNEPGEAVD
jgi:hypothetical protein